MDLHEYLKKLLEDIAKMQEKRKIDETLADICKKLDGFSPKIKKSIEDGTDLDQKDLQELESLTKSFNENLKKLANLNGYESLISFSKVQ